MSKLAALFLCISSIGNTAFSMYQRPNHMPSVPVNSICCLEIWYSGSFCQQSSFGKFRAASCQLGCLRVRESSNSDHMGQKAQDSKIANIETNSAPFSYFRATQFTSYDFVSLFESSIIMFSKLTRPQVKLHRMNNTPALTNTTPLNQMKQLVRTATAPQSLAKIHLTQKIQAVTLIAMVTHRAAIAPLLAAWQLPVGVRLCSTMTPFLRLQKNVSTAS